jgi:phosphoesterase RecJ-like protein
LKTRPQIVSRILDTIEAAKTVCIVGHIRPDGDCLGSQISLALALRAAGKTVTVWNQDPVPEKLRFLDPEKLVQPPRRGETFDLVIATDCASFERLGKTGECVGQRGLLVNIDHHASNTRYGDVNWVLPRVPATGELIYRLLKWARWPFSTLIADNLFAAISTDTGSFQYSNTRPSTMRVAADLVQRGANLGKVCHEIYQSFPLPRVRLVQHVYNRFRLAAGGRLAYFWLKQADFARTGASPEDAEGLIDHIRAIEGVVAAIVFEELSPELTRISLRSKDDSVDVNEVAKLFGGGGHSAAAGARIPGKPPGVQRRVVAAVKAALDRKR